METEKKKRSLCRKKGDRVEQKMEVEEKIVEQINKGARAEKKSRKWRREKQREQNGQETCRAEQKRKKGRTESGKYRK
jgi:hypothetical protein